MTRLTRIAFRGLLASLAALPSLSAFSPVVAFAAVGETQPPSTTLSSVQRLHLPEITQTRLDNGLTVVLEENHRAPFVSMQLRYAAGSRDDPPGKEGVSGLTQRMMVMRTKHVPVGMYDTWLDRIGASDRGWFAGSDSTSVWATVPASAVPVMLWLWSDQMGFFAPDDPKVLENARKTAKTERREKVEGVAYGAVRELTVQALFPPGHPYHGSPVAGSIDTVTTEDVRAFHDRNFAPNDAVLVLSGDFGSAEVTDQIRKYFDPIPSAAIDTPPISPARLEGEVRLDVAASVQAPMVLINWRTPAYYDAGDAELDVAARVLAGSRISLLYWGLVDQRQVATRVTAGQRSHALGSDFQIQAFVAPGHTPDQVISAIDQILATARRPILNDQAYRVARDNVTIPRIYELDRPARRVALYAEYTLLRHDPGWLANDVGRYEALTPVDVNAAIQRWLTPGHRVVTVVTPDPSAPACGVLRATRGDK